MTRGLLKLLLQMHVRYTTALHNHAKLGNACMSQPHAAILSGINNGIFHCQDN